MIDLYKFNPDWNFATEHGLACRPGRKIIIQGDIINPEQKVCMCCLNIIRTQDEPLCHNSKELYFLGTGFPILYLFIKHCFVLVLLMIVSYNAIAMYRAIQYNQIPCSNQNPNYHRLLAAITDFHCTTWMIRLSITNRVVDGEETIIRIFSFVIHLLMLVYMRDSISKTIRYYDQRQCSLSDFAIKIKSLPLQKNIQQKLRKFFSSAFLESHQVKQITLLPDYEQLQKLEHEQTVIRKKYHNQLKNKNQNTQALDHISSELHKIQKMVQNQLKRYKQLAQNDMLQTSKAIVVFETQFEKRIIIEQAVHFNRQFYEQYFEGQCKKIKITGAPQPREIIWEDINYPTHKRFFRIIIGWVLSILLVACATVVIYFILNQKAEFLLVSDDSNVGVAIFLVYLLIVLIICFNKFIMGFALHYFTHLQKHDTKSKLQASFSFKYALGMFFTTALMTLAVEAISFKNFYSHLYGVIQQETIFFFMNAFFVPLIWLVNPFQLLVLLRRKLYFGRDDIPQKMANHIMEDFHYDMGKRYAEVLETMWFTFLYLTIIPFGAMLTLCGLVIYYWVDKYNLLRRSSVKQKITGQLASWALKQLDLTLFFRAIGQVAFDAILRDGVHAQSIVILSISVVYLILPIEKLINFFNHQQFYLNQVRYSEVKGRFKDTYRSLNPVYVKINPQKMRQRLKTTMTQLMSAKDLYASQSRLNTKI